MNTKHLVQQQFGLNAAAYAVSPVHARGASLERVVELSAPQSGDLALDVATATGHMAFALAPRVRKVIGLDITVGMFAEGRRLSAERGIANVEWLGGDVEALPLADESFDIVMCRISLHHWPDAPRGVAEMARVVKRGGRVVLVDNYTQEDERLAAFVNRFETIRDPSHHWAYSIRALQGMFAAAGLRVDATETLEKATPFLDWVKRMQTPPAAILELEALLRTPEAAATLRGFEQNGETHFFLYEAIISAMRP